MILIHIHTHSITYYNTIYFCFDKVINEFRKKKKEVYYRLKKRNYKWK